MDSTGGRGAYRPHDVTRNRRSIVAGRVRPAYSGHDGSSDLYMVAAVFMGIFACTTEDGHIRVDVVAQFFKGKVRRVVEVIGLVVMAVYFAIFSYGLYLQAVKSWTRSETVDAIFLELPVWPSRWIAVAGIVFSLLSVLYLFRLGWGSRHGELREVGQ